MAQFCLRFQGVITLALLTLVTGCSSSQPHAQVNKNSSPKHLLGIRPVSQESPIDCRPIDSFNKGINKAMGAATLAQSATSKQDWDLVVSNWLQAIGAMQAVLPDNPKRVFAQKKVAEYFKNLEVAMQKASTTSSVLPFTSFGNSIFDEQLSLYLSYIAAMGVPDILIVGSSRALVGIDPQQLQQALAANGKGNLKIFNFGVNGGTAQMVDFQLRQVLSREQLPRLILWADGVRAFNSGRPDRTYESIVASAGYQRLRAGERPQLPASAPEIPEGCEEISDPSTSSAAVKKSTVLGPAMAAIVAQSWQQVGTSVKMPRHSSPIEEQPLIAQLDGVAAPTQLALARSNAGYASSAINSTGFLPLDDRFDPKTYYQNNPRVAGRYDADYQPFSLAGRQMTAFNSVKAFARQQQIPFVLVNLPLNQDYLDWVRRSREQQFQTFMQRQVGNGFYFIDMARQWPKQNDYFSDPSHLNRYGAAAVASQLANNSDIPWPEAR
jgi:hypothetical protein